MPGLLAAADTLEETACVVVAGDPAHPRATALAAATLASPDPAVVLLHGATPGAVPSGHPAAGKTAAPDGPVAYVCRRNVCGLPLADPASLSAALWRRQ
jgi:hypothetical protein